MILEGKGDARDIIFVGDPTPDMMPIDDEARAISESFAKKWKHPIESLPGTYSDTVLDNLQKQVAEVHAKQSQPQQLPGMEQLMASMAAMMKQNQELIAALTGKVLEEPKIERRA